MSDQGPRRSRRLATRQDPAVSGKQPPAAADTLVVPAKGRRRSSKRQPEQSAGAAASPLPDAQAASTAAADKGAAAGPEQPLKRPRGRPRKAAAAAAAEAEPAADTAAEAVPADVGTSSAAAAADQQSKQAASRAGRSSAPAKAKAGKAKAAAGGPSREAEAALWAQGYKLVAGVDEAGRGPLAGPVVAAAAILPPDAVFPLLNDSKQLSEEQREVLYSALTTHPGVAWAVSVVDHEVIDEINILQAAMLAMTQAVQSLPAQPDHLLIDGNRKPAGLANMPLQLLVKGDATSSCIAAASVIAKVTRDRLMLDLDKQFPAYGFAQHKGYGVPAHRAAIQQHGPCDIHRRSFEPVKSLTGWAGYGQKAKAAAAAAAAAAAGGSRAAMCMA